MWGGLNHFTMCFHPSFSTYLVNLTYMSLDSCKKLEYLPENLPTPQKKAQQAGGFQISISKYGNAKLQTKTGFGGLLPLSVLR